jgi:hypothetical protein
MPMNIPTPGEQSNQCQEKHEEPEGALLKATKKPTQG